jgi:DNA-binding PadR family transcriptional regulator
MQRSRLTYNGALVLAALARGYRYGFEIMDFTALPSGTAYPILRRFELEKLVRSRWEGERSAWRDGRPRRRYYELSEEGRKLLSTALERFSEHRRVFEEAVAEPGSSG